jgi:hypothetical protein
MEQKEKQQITKALSQLALSDCKEISVRFAEIIAYLQKDEYLAALGTLAGLDNQFQFVETVLQATARINQK